MPAFLVAVVLGLCLAGCSFDYEASSGAASEAPDAIFDDFSHTVYLNGVKVLSLTAAHAEAYEDGGRTVLRGVSFTEYDRATGKVATAGTAEGATFWSETENAEFSGRIRITSQRDDASLSTEFLAWDGKKKLLSSGLDRTVEIRRGDGSWVRGAGFSADSRRRSFAFREAVEGNLVTKDEAAGASPDAATAAAASVPAGTEGTP